MSIRFELIKDLFFLKRFIKKKSSFLDIFNPHNLKNHSSMRIILTLSVIFLFLFTHAQPQIGVELVASGFNEPIDRQAPNIAP